MTHLVLHIGSGKTGSTAIQTALVRCSDRMASSGIAYPAGLQGHHNELEAALLPPARWHRVHRVQFGGREHELVDRAEKLIAGCRESLATNQVTLMSSEYLCSLPASDVRALLHRFDGCAPGVSAVMYVRQPSAYLLSGLQQFLKHEHDVRGFLNQTYPFRNAVRNWTQALGTGRMIVREFSRNALVGGDVVSDFAGVLSDLAGSPIDLGVPEAAANVSVSAEECVLLQEFKRAAAISVDPALHRHNQVINIAIARAARGLELTRMAFRPGIAELIDRHHAEDLSLLRSTAGIDFGIDLPPLDAAGRAELDRWAAFPDVEGLLVIDQGRLDALRKRARRHLLRTESLAQT